jgi:hypothetical protein
VAPIAATRSSAAFVIVTFGLAVSVIDEDREAVEFGMRLKGHGPEEIAKALEVATAAEAIFESGVESGYEAFDAVRDKYRAEPWYKDIRGDFTYAILGMSAAEIRKAGPAFGINPPFRYDPMSTIAAVRAPQLWVLGGQDLDAPSGETARRLQSLIAKGRPITLAVYPEAEHGMTEFETTTGESGLSSRPGASRLSTRYVEGYFRMMRDFARDGVLAPPYGDARIIRPGSTSADSPDRPPVTRRWN